MKKGVKYHRPRDYNRLLKGRRNVFEIFKKLKTAAIVFPPVQESYWEDEANSVGHLDG